MASNGRVNISMFPYVPQRIDGGLIIALHMENGKFSFVFHRLSRKCFFAWMQTLFLAETE